MLLQALRVKIEMKNLHLQVTFLVQKVWERVPTPKRGVGTPFPPHYTPGFATTDVIQISTTRACYIH